MAQVNDACSWSPALGCDDDDSGYDDDVGGGYDDDGDGSDSDDDVDVGRSNC